FDVTWFAIPSPFVWWQVALAVVAYAFASFVVGLFGIAGGVIYAPALLMLPGVSPAAAVSTVFVSSWPMSCCRLMQLHYYGRIKWRLALPMAMAASAALPAQLAVQYVPKAGVILFVAAVALFAGAQTMWGIRRARRLLETQAQGHLEAGAVPFPAVYLAKDPPLAQSRPTAIGLFAGLDCAPCFGSPGSKPQRHATVACPSEATKPAPPLSPQLSKDPELPLLRSVAI
ncbi:unnamed protein product, partial [Polarella glacialis]